MTTVVVTRLHCLSRWPAVPPSRARRMRRRARALVPTLARRRSRSASATPSPGSGASPSSAFVLRPNAADGRGDQHQAARGKTLPPRAPRACCGRRLRGAAVRARSAQRLTRSFNESLTRLVNTMRCAPCVTFADGGERSDAFRQFPAFARRQPRAASLRWRGRRKGAWILISGLRGGSCVPPAVTCGTCRPARLSGRSPKPPRRRPGFTRARCSLASRSRCA
jgi:hypothetical protein